MRTSTRIAAFATSAFALAQLLGCACGNCPVDQTDAAAPANTEASEAPSYEEQRAAVLALAPRENVTIFSGIDGSEASWSELVGAAASADAVLIGEMHGHDMGLSAAATLWKDVLAAAPFAAEPALCLEFFERDQQLALDDYLAGITDEDTFRKHARRSSGNYPPGHAVMVELAKKAGAPVIAANAPRRYVRMARTGYESYDMLNPAQRALLETPLQMPGDEYHERFVDLMSSMGASHGAPAPEDQTPEEAEAKQEAARQMAESIYRSQVVWDATMSDSVADALASGHRPVFLVIGRFHIDHYGGTLDLLEAKAPEARILTISMADKAPNRSDGSDGLDPEDLGRADFVVYVADPAPKDSARLAAAESDSPN